MIKYGADLCELPTDLDLKPYCIDSFNSQITTNITVEEIKQCEQTENNQIADSHFDTEVSSDLGYIDNPFATDEILYHAAQDNFDADQP